MTCDYGEHRCEGCVNDQNGCLSICADCGDFRMCHDAKDGCDGTEEYPPDYDVVQCQYESFVSGN